MTEKREIDYLFMTPAQWADGFDENAHKIVFGKLPPPGLIVDLALYAADGTSKSPLAYATVRELDRDNCYLQFGGAVPEIRGTVVIHRIYDRFIEMLALKWKYTTTRIENDNIAYLRLAMAKGFRICGTASDGQKTLVELSMELPHAKFQHASEQSTASAENAGAH